MDYHYAVRLLYLIIKESNMDQRVSKPNGKEITELKIDPLVFSSSTRE